jgi:hypothetical protein
MLIGRALHGDIEHEKLLEDWPRLLDTLARQDLPANLRVVAPGDTYTRGHQIWQVVERLMPPTVKLLQEARNGWTDRAMVTFRDLSRDLEVLHEHIAQLEQELQKAYRQTFA